MHKNVKGGKITQISVFFPSWEKIKKKRDWALKSGDSRVVMNSINMGVTAENIREGTLTCEGTKVQFALKPGCLNTELWAIRGLTFMICLQSKLSWMLSDGACAVGGSHYRRQLSASCCSLGQTEDGENYSFLSLLIQFLEAAETQIPIQGSRDSCWGGPGKAIYTQATPRLETSSSLRSQLVTQISVQTPAIHPVFTSNAPCPQQNSFGRGSNMSLINTSKRQ